ncbi:DASH family cryptochrome [Halobacillus sp. KGW1]|uniref:DASH family cryptochrome n=1 Tax=Halobacillus sp. KGW1 TaxID=1793726 RepID=UPI000784A7DA|nr:DASH family cryptochrome [Halobacillus sp. KGW1]
MQNGALVWFRNDLRVHDHHPLHQAVQSGKPVIGMYVFDPAAYEQGEDGIRKTDRHRARFLIESIHDLRKNLGALGIPLIVRCRRATEAIHEIKEKIKIDAVYVHEEIGREEQTVEENVRQALPDTAFHVEHGHNLYLPDDLPFSIQELPDTFSQFRKRLEKSGTAVRKAIAPPAPEGQAELPVPEGDIPTLETLGFDPADEAPRYPGGSSEARKRLIDYIFTKDRLKIYKQTRNGMLKEDDSSKFSPYLANGCLSPRVVYEQIKAYERTNGANESTYMLYFELLWRDYFHLVHRKYGDRIFYRSGLSGKAIPWERDEKLLQAWIDGKTGYPLVDAGMRELKETGFLSNRGRQNVASFFTKNLGLDWRIGARWFESQLVDYDVSSNYGNWLYIAGVGNDAVPFRAFNVEKQAKDYDPDGSYLRHWLPELAALPADWIHQPREMGMIEQQQYGIVLGEHYPLPVVDLYESMRKRKEAFAAADR